MGPLVHTPAPPLAGFVEYLWSLNHRPAHARERIVPSGTLELVINLAADEFRIHDAAGRARRLAGAMVSGAYGGWFVADTRAHQAIVGAHFRPAGARPFLGVPPGALADDHVELAALWGAAAVAELRERLAAAATPAQRFGLLEGALRERLRPARRHPAVQVGVERLGRAATTVRDLARDVALSHRRFIELFTADVGMTPKRFAQVRRFQRAHARARGLAAPDWAQLALASGYCDQSHMIREFVALAGFSPAELHRRAAGVKEHHAREGSRSSNPGGAARGRSRG